MIDQQTSAGVYSCPRLCPEPGCRFEALDRRAFWAHMTEAHPEPVALHWLGVTAERGRERMTTTQRREAAHRLGLPRPWDWTVTQAREAEDCIGCAARYERNIRVVHAIRGCPAHAHVSLGQEGQR